MVVILNNGFSIFLSVFIFNYFFVLCMCFRVIWFVGRFVILVLNVFIMLVFIVVSFDFIVLFVSFFRFFVYVIMGVLKFFRVFFVWEKSGFVVRILMMCDVKGIRMFLLIFRIVKVIIV